MASSSSAFAADRNCLGVFDLTEKLADLMHQTFQCRILEECPEAVVRYNGLFSGCLDVPVWLKEDVRHMVEVLALAYRSPGE